MDYVLNAKRRDISEEEQIKLDKFLKKTWKRAIFNHHNLLWRHLSSLSTKKKQENYDHAKIIII